MKISVVMIDGEFRENTYGAKYLSEQNFPDDEYEVFWVEYYNKVPDSVLIHEKVTVIKLDNPKTKEYHSSICFNEGIKQAKGELIVIPDADQIVKSDFLSNLWDIHSKYDKLVVYPYRYDEANEGVLDSLSFDELDEKCILKNPNNHGGCMSVRKKWLLEINGYEQHDLFSSGFHANGKDIYTRFKNLGLGVMWAPHIKMYHPWHPYTLADATQYVAQKKFIDWRFQNLQYKALNGINSSLNATKIAVESIIKAENIETPKQSVLKKIANKFK